MKKIGYIEKTTHELSPDIWRKLIDEIPELDRDNDNSGFDNLLYAFLVVRGDRVGKFEWSDEDEEIVVRGEMEEVGMVAERIAVRLGGRFMQCL